MLQVAPQQGVRVQCWPRVESLDLTDGTGSSSSRGHFDGTMALKMSQVLSSEICGYVVKTFLVFRIFEAMVLRN